MIYGHTEELSDIQERISQRRYTNFLGQYHKFSFCLETEPRVLPFPAAAGQGENAPTVEVDGILSLEDAVDISALLETSTIGGERIQWQNFNKNNKTLQVGFCDKISKLGLQCLIIMFLCVGLCYFKVPPACRFLLVSLFVVQIISYLKWVGLP